mmetsp:Transcript_10884/g.15080  ORF Transcript_10884/g.15080 Transcript_10884/m.15080 type:complete len:214 (-) Transcript_10884:916-1557(-)
MFLYPVCNRNLVKRVSYLLFSSISCGSSDGFRSIPGANTIARLENVILFTEDCAAISFAIEEICFKTLRFISGSFSAKSCTSCSPGLLLAITIASAYFSVGISGSASSRSHCLSNPAGTCGEVSFTVYIPWSNCFRSRTRSSFFAESRNIPSTVKPPSFRIASIMLTTMIGTSRLGRFPLCSSMQCSSVAKKKELGLPSNLPALISFSWHESW